MDPLQALQAAYSVPPDSEEQSELLSNLRLNLESNPAYIPVLCSSLIRGIPGAHDSLLKRWTLDLVYYGIARANLLFEKRTDLANQSLDVLAGLLNDPNPEIVKTTVQCFGTVYPLLFRHLCINRSQRGIWDTLSSCRKRIIEMLWSPTSTSGIKLAALKFVQRVILVQTRGVSDPRLQKPNDPNLSFCPADHPFIPVAQLEAEGQKLVESIITIFYTMPNPDMMAAVVNTLGQLVKLRPSLQGIIITALTTWTPAAINHLSATAVRSVEKSVRILLLHLHFSRTLQISSTYKQQLGEAIATQSARMAQAVTNEKNRKAAAAAEASRKRSISALSEEATEAKRQKMDNGASTASVASVLANFDFSILPHTLVTELIIANLQALTEQSLTAAINAYKRANGFAVVPADIPAPVPIVADTEMHTEIHTETHATHEAAEPDSEVKVEPVDPLAMDMGDDEVDYEPEKLNIELAREEALASELPDENELIDLDKPLQLANFRLPPPREFLTSEKESIMKSSMSRIWNTNGLLGNSTVAFSSQQVGQGASSEDLWMLLLVRMITRASPGEGTAGVDEGEKLESAQVGGVSVKERIRQIVFDYVLTDFPGRERLAVTWMNEEWYNDSIRAIGNPEWFRNYPVWVERLVSAYEPLLDNKDKTLSRFLLDIPSVPQSSFNILRDLCCEKDRMQVGFSTLREFVLQRPPLRTQAMKILLDLTTHHHKVTRGAAIITVKRWVPDVQPMGEMVRTFAIRLLGRLQKQTSGTRQPGDVKDDTMEDGEMPQDERVQTKFLPDKIELPADKSLVLQHVELIFALCAKYPEFLDEIFDSYVHMDISIQEAIQDLITALIRSLGPNNAKLLAIMQNFPAGAESLALRVLTIFTENGRPSASLVSLVKGLMSQRDLDAKFLIPVIAEMDKADIIQYLPRIVSMLNGTAETKQLVKNVFESIVTTPPQTFGSVTSNLPRVRQSELLQPAELMVLLHESEKEIGLKSTIEAIGICFSMTDVFRYEVLAVVMQQIVDEPVLPVLFLRTVIQAVTTYKSLVGYVSTTLLSRLITKKIWTNPPLWEGFIRCAKTIAPASFGALLQLPKDQLRELVDKQPGLKAGLREFVLKKAGNKARQTGFLDLFGEDPGQQQQQQQSQQAQSQPLPAL